MSLDSVNPVYNKVLWDNLIHFSEDQANQLHKAQEKANQEIREQEAGN